MLSELCSYRKPTVNSKLLRAPTTSQPAQASCSVGNTPVSYRQQQRVFVNRLQPLLSPVNCHRETYIKQEVGESPNDRNDRAIRVATAWYAQRLPQMEVYLLTNDAENRRKALEQGLKAMSVQVYSWAPSLPFPYPPPSSASPLLRFLVRSVVTNYAGTDGRLNPVDRCQRP